MLNNFYADKTILITGATGFLGKIHIYKQTNPPFYI